MDSNLECSAKCVAKTDACTNCYSRICDTCQIREDFLFQDGSARSHRSELFVDEIYTCNKCDQKWMYLFSYCVTCSRLVCRSFKDKHDNCEKHYGLMESDIRKRRKLVEIEKEIEQFALNLEKSRNDLNEICERERHSTFISVLKSSVRTIISKIEDTENSYARDSELLKTQLLTVEQYLVQQNDSFKHFKERLQTIRRKITFPVEFLQELSKWEKSFLKLRNNHSRFDLSTLNSTPVINVHCRPTQLDQYSIEHILGIQELSVYRDPRREGNCHSNESHENPICSGSSARIPDGHHAGSLTGCAQEETAQKSKTLPHLTKKYDPYKLHLLETEIKSKDEYIQKLKLEQATLKHHIYLLKNSRNSADWKLKEITKKFETKLQERDQVHNEELQTVIDYKNQLEEDLREVKTKMEHQLKTQEKEYEDLKARQGKHIHDMASEIELLKLDAQKTEDASKKAANDAINENQKAEERIKHKETEDENQRIKAKLQKIKHMFNEWTQSSSSLNNMMAQELNFDDVFIQGGSEQQHRTNDALSSNAISASMTARENMSVNKEESTTTVADVSSGNNKTKHITSVSYTAEHIHIIQNSQVSLTDSGYDAQSLIGEIDREDINQ